MLDRLDRGTNDDPRLAQAGGRRQGPIRRARRQAPGSLFAFINRMHKLQPPRTDTPEQKQAFLLKSHAAMLEAADKILATKPARQASPESRAGESGGSSR